MTFLTNWLADRGPSEPSHDGGGMLGEAVTGTSGDQMPIWRDGRLGWILLIVLVLYGLRVADQPIRGEESRWAQGAREMMETGDWIVPRQQKQVFPERPPLNSWLIALANGFSHELTPWAVRMPSILATLLTCVVLYVYVAQAVGRQAALAVALVFATLGQVLQLGRLGESEAVLTCCVSVSLLGWHAFYQAGRPGLAWQIGFVFAGLAALTKGLQGPVYFVAVTSLWLAAQRQWWFWCHWSWWAGLTSMAYVIGSWMFPFASMTSPQAVRDVWTGLIADRVTWSGMAEHLVAYPLETLGCLLPWSVFLIQLLNREFRRELRPFRQPLAFAAFAFVLTYPTVWWVTGARGRYFMPLYPMAAIVLGTLAWQSWQGRMDSWAFRGWWRFVKVLTVAMGTVAVVAGVALSGHESLQPLARPTGWLSLALGGSLATGALLSGLLWFHRQPGVSRELRRQLGAVSFVISVLWLGLAYGTLGINPDLEFGDTVPEGIASVKSQLPARPRLVSFGPVHHRFEYHWGRPIAQQPWPESRDALPTGVEYFCLDYNVADTPEQRISGRGRTWTTTSGTLPFAWEEVARIPIDREYLESRNWVIIGRVLRSESSADDPQSPQVARRPVTADGRTEPDAR